MASPNQWQQVGNRSNSEKTGRSCEGPDFSWLSSKVSRTLPRPSGQEARKTACPARLAGRRCPNSGWELGTRPTHSTLRMCPQNRIPWMKRVVSVHSSMVLPPRWRHLKTNIRAFIIHLPPRTLPSCCPALPRPPIPCPVQTSGTRLLPFHREIQLSSVDEFRTSIHPLHSSATPPRHSKGPVDDRRAAIHPSHVAAMLLHKEISQQSAMDGRR